MKDNNKPPDAVFEDIYDFSDINGKSSEPQRLGKTYTLNESGEIVRPKYHPKVSDDRVRLPPVVIGSSLVSQTPTAKAAFSGKDEKYSGEKNWTRHIPAHRDLKTALDQRRLTDAHLASDVPRQSKNFQDLGKYSREEKLSGKLDQAEYDPVYRSLMKDVQDKSMLERSTQVQEYERRNKIKQLTEPGQRFPSSVQQPNQDHLSGDIFTRRVREYEAGLKAGSSIHSAGSRLHNAGSSVHSAGSSIHQNIPVSIKESVYQPVPPRAPKQESETSSFTRNRRLSRYTSTQVDREIEIDYDQEVAEAVRVQKELDLLHKELAEMKKAKMVNEMQTVRPTSAASANSNLPGCSTPCLIPTSAVPYKTAEPVKTWNGDTARRGLGFRSKIKKERQTEIQLETSHIPEKIRKEMKKYFS